MNRWSPYVSLGLCLLRSALAVAVDPSEVFEQRLMPIFRSENPSSCVQCHLSSVDLKDYILPSSRETFLALRDQGLIDVERPSDSKILHLISMGDADSDAMAKRIHAKTRQAEYEAFASWIEACCQDQELLSSKTEPAVKQAGPAKANEVIRHTRKDRVLDSFVRNIWSQRMRCFPCHTPHELDVNNPLHATPIGRHKEFETKYGARMNIFKETPQATLQALIASSSRQHLDRLPLLNVENPAESLLLLKPMAKLPPKGESGQIGEPSSQVPVSHMGGIKIHQDDFSYKAMLAWLQDYAHSVKDQYATPEVLPEDNWYPTEHVVRVTGVTADWPELSTVQIFVYRWNAAGEKWEDAPVAFTQAKLTPRRIINGTLFVLSQLGGRKDLSSFGETLPPGKVQLRLHVDRDGQLTRNPTLLLAGKKPDATATLEAQFRNGFAQADIVEGTELVYTD